MDNPVLTRYRRISGEDRQLDWRLPSISKTRLVIDELLSTERTYIHELASLLEFYMKPYEELQDTAQMPQGLRGRSRIIFGNIVELHELHARRLLPELQRASSSPDEICQVLLNCMDSFLEAYRLYCRNKPMSETLRRENMADDCRFFVYCKKRAGHQLPLSAYLLKPVQRITKYQLLLSELLRHCRSEGHGELVCATVQAALHAMLEFLSQINADMEQLQILGYTHDLHLLGTLRLQTTCQVWTFELKTHKLARKVQHRQLFLFDSALLFCKQHEQSKLLDRFVYKTQIPIDRLGFAECSKQIPEHFELWDWSCKSAKGFSIYIHNDTVRAKWIQLLSHLTIFNAYQWRDLCPHTIGDAKQALRSNSWAGSLDDVTSSKHSSFEDSGCPVDENFNHEFSTRASSLSTNTESLCTSFSLPDSRASERCKDNLVTKLTAQFEALNATYPS